MLSKNFILALSACALSLVTAQSHAQENVTTLSLVCTGDGTLTVSESKKTKIQNDSDSTQTATADTSFRRQVPFKGTAYIEINGVTGRVRIPEQLDSTVTNGKDGWFDIQELVVAEREITGKIRVNMLNRPRLKVDRFSGVVTLGDEADNFTGQCERAENAKPKF